MIESPVSWGEFAAGSDLMLWRPGIDRRRIRWRAMVTVRHATTAGYAVLGTVAIILGAHATSRPFWWVMVLVGIVLVAGSVVVLAVQYHCADCDHRHGGATCVLCRERSRFFYRRGDVADLPPPLVDAVDQLFTSVHSVHASRAAQWLAPEHLRDIHQMAWNAVTVIDRTRDLHTARSDPACVGCLDADDEHPLTMVDDVLDRVLSCLDQVVLLVRVWEHKLSCANLLNTALPDTLADIVADTGRQADALPEAVFAYITAARDVTNAGPFPWEHDPKPARARDAS
jgi:hypothetical protein